MTTSDDIETGWTPWEPGTLPTTFTEEQITGAMRISGFTRERAIAALQNITLDEIWMNNYFQVNKRNLAAAPDWPAMVHLSVKRRDRKPLGVEHFRVLQRIKNDLVGPEHWAVEIYPAEEHLIDTSNQYHLFVIGQPKWKFPFGFHEGRMVLTENIGGAVQRPFPTIAPATPEQLLGDT